MGADRLRCPRGHNLARVDHVVSCELHDGHEIYVCPMRHGASPCGLRVAVPELGNCQAEPSKAELGELA